MSCRGSKIQTHARRVNERKPLSITLLKSTALLTSTQPSRIPILFTGQLISVTPMAADSPFLSSNRYAVVTGANKGIGLEICRQLASHGVIVVLTSRDESRGIQAVENLKNQDNSLSDCLEFHQLDVADPLSVASLAGFVKSKFGKLDILVNNAGILGMDMDSDSFAAAVRESTQPREQIKDDTEIMPSSKNYDMAVQCLNTNYYGAKRLTESFLPLLRLSDSPRIVNVSSIKGRLKNIPNERVRGILDDVESLTEEKIDEILNEFLQDLKKGELKIKGWPSFLPPYAVSKAAMNAYTRIMANKYPDVDVNCVCTGYVKTDINYNTGVLSVEEGAESPMRLALVPKGQVSGMFFDRKEASTF